MKNLFLTPFLILFVITSAITSAGATEPAASAGGDIAAGQEKSAACAACHSTDGNSMVPAFPKIAGQHAPYLLKQMQDFASAADRSNGIMSGQVAALTPEDMSDLAAYFASQEAAPGTAQGDAGTIALGKRIYHGGNSETALPACKSCHGPLGKGNRLAGFPSLAGQHAAYTSAQLKTFRSGERKNDAKSMMGATAEKLTDREIEAVSQYIAGLR